MNDYSFIIYYLSFKEFERENYFWKESTICYNHKKFKGVAMSIDEIKMLDISERIILVEEIWDSIAQEQDNIKLSEYEKKILDARLESSSDKLLSWDEIKDKIQNR